MENSTNLPSQEPTPVQKKFIEVIKKLLKSPEAVVIHYNDPKKRGIADEIFSVIDSEDGKTHLVIRAVSQKGGINLVGLERHDFVQVVWLNEQNNQTGQIQFINRPDYRYISHMTTVEPEDVEIFKESGGMSFDPTGVSVLPKQIEILTQILEQGHVNNELTNNAFQYLEENWKAAKIIRPNSNQTPQIT